MITSSLCRFSPDCVLELNLLKDQIGVLHTEIVASSQTDPVLIGRLYFLWHELSCTSLPANNWRLCLCQWVTHDQLLHPRASDMTQLACPQPFSLLKQEVVLSPVPVETLNTAQGLCCPSQGHVCSTAACSRPVLALDPQLGVSVVWKRCAPSSLCPFLPCPELFLIPMGLSDPHQPLSWPWLLTLLSRLSPGCHSPWSSWCGTRAEIIALIHSCKTCGFLSFASQFAQNNPNT